MANNGAAPPADAGSAGSCVPVHACLRGRAPGVLQRAGLGRACGVLFPCSPDDRLKLSGVGRKKRGSAQGNSLWSLLIGHLRLIKVSLLMRRLKFNCFLLSPWECSEGFSACLPPPHQMNVNSPSLPRARLYLCLS